MSSGTSETPMMMTHAIVAIVPVRVVAPASSPKNQ
jgi:hypothetical protein